MLSEEDGKFLLRLARKTIENHVNNKKTQMPDSYPEPLNEKRGIFCTLNKSVNGERQLRGCIGIPYPVKPVIEAVIEAARGSCEDPRFPPMSKEELDEVKIEISVLTEPELIEDFSPDKVNNKDGLILEYGPYSGLFLPQVWEQIPDKNEFLDSLCLKAGISPGMWKDARIYKFNVQVFEE